MKDALGDRMKSDYENRTRYTLPRRSYTIVRVDGRAFHTYTRELKRPFDDDFINDMDATAAYLCQNMSGAKCAFIQSDEISVLLTDFDNIGTEAWFDNNLQKICSVSAAMATAAFNNCRIKRHLEANGTLTDDFKMAEFDSRVFQIPSKGETENYFIWRQQDTTRNSIAAVAQSLYSHKELSGKSANQQQEMIFQKGINWNDFATKYKRGRLIVQEFFERNGATRSRWISSEVPIFTQERAFLRDLIPDNV
jgi:tRNA(His) guanylyltransferase